MAVVPHDIRVGTDVYSADGHKLGSLHRVVLRRSDLTLTHVVVDIGFLRSGHHLWEGGLGLDYDRVVPLDAVSEISDQRVELALTAQKFKDAPEYTEESFEAPPDFTPSVFDLPDVISRGESWAAALNSTPRAWVFERLNRPLDGVDIKEGTDVWRREPHEKVGEIKRLLFGDPGGALQALVVQRGFLLHRDVILPARYIAELFDDVVRVDISDHELGRLREYEGD